MTTNEAKQVIDKLDKLSVPILAFSGGEPLVRKDIFQLTKYAHNKGIYISIATNGTLITKKKTAEEVATSFKQFCDTVFTSYKPIPIYFISIKPPKRR